MEFEVCEHVRMDSAYDAIRLDDLDRWVVDVFCTDCGAEGYVVISNNPKLHWDVRTLPEWRAVLNEKDIE